MIYIPAESRTLIREYNVREAFGHSSRVTRLFVVRMLLVAHIIIAQVYTPIKYRDGKCLTCNIEVG